MYVKGKLNAKLNSVMGKQKHAQYIVFGQKKKCSLLLFMLNVDVRSMNNLLLRRESKQIKGIRSRKNTHKVSYQAKATGLRSIYIF